MSLHLGVTHYAFAFGAKLLAKNGLTKEFCEKSVTKCIVKSLSFNCLNFSGAFHSVSRVSL